MCRKSSVRSSLLFFILWMLSLIIEVCLDSVFYVVLEWKLLSVIEKFVLCSILSIESSVMLVLWLLLRLIMMCFGGSGSGCIVMSILCVSFMCVGWLFVICLSLMLVIDCMSMCVVVLCMWLVVVWLEEVEKRSL